MWTSFAVVSAVSPRKPSQNGTAAIGVVGVGSFGQHHARVLHQMDGVAASGVFDIDSARCASVGQQLGVPVWNSIAELLAVSDAVVVATPTEAHEAVALESMRAGVSVLVEKPMAPNVAAADRIIRAADCLGVVLQVGHIERFNPAVRAAGPYLERPLLVECRRLSPFVSRSLDVPVVMDLMIHDIDLLLNLVGEDVVTEVEAVGRSVISGRTDTADATIAFAGGTVAKLTSSRVATDKRRTLCIWQHSGCLSLDLSVGRGEYHIGVRHNPEMSSNGHMGHPHRPGAKVSGDRRGEDRIPILGDDGEPLTLELEAFRDAVLGWAPPVVTGHDGRRALELAEIIEKRIEEYVAYSGTPSP